MELQQQEADWKLSGELKFKITHIIFVTQQTIFNIFKGQFTLNERKTCGDQEHMQM